MIEDIQLSGKNNAEGQTKLQRVIGIPYAVLKISDEELRVAIANAKFLTDSKNFNSECSETLKRNKAAVWNRQANVNYR